MDVLRRMVEKCDKLEGFVIAHSVGGGTGSGTGALLADRMSVEYGKKTKLGVTVFPSRSILNTVVEPYNGIGVL